jgi:hypothetical protein
MARKKSKRQIMREYEAFSRNGKNAGMKTSPYAEREKKPRKERAKLRLGKPLLWAALGVLLLAAAACAAVLLKDRAHDAARCYCVLADKNELRIGMSDESERKVASIIKKTKLDAGGAQKSDHKLVVNGKEYYYNRVSGRISYLEGSASAILSESDRLMLNDMIGMGAVTNVENPSSSGYKIKPLLIVTEGEDARIELEFTCSRETQIPYMAVVARLNDEGEWIDQRITPEDPGRIIAINKVGRIAFPLDPEFISREGNYVFVMQEYSESPAAITISGGTGDTVIPGESVVIPISINGSRSIEFTVKKGRGDGALKLYRDEYSLMEQYPQLASLDTKDGVDICICVDYGNYRCTLLPPGQRSALEMAAAAESASGGHSLTLEEARTMLEHYGVPREKVFVKPYNSPFSSVLPAFDPNEEYFREYLKRLLYDEVEKEEDAEPGPTERPEGFPTAHSDNVNVHLTAVAWDLGGGAYYEEGFSADTIDLNPAPCIAVRWVNLGTETLTYGSMTALQYLNADGEYETCHSNAFVMMDGHTLLPGGSAVERYFLGSYDMVRSGRYRLWLSVDPLNYYISSEDSLHITQYVSLYCVDFDFNALERRSEP